MSKKGKGSKVMLLLSSITWFDVLVQGLGVLGITASVVGFQCKTHKSIMISRTLNETLFAVQYGLLGAFTGMAMNIIGSIRNLIFAKLVEKGKSTMPLRFVFSAAFVAFAICTWDGAKSILVGVAKVVSTFAYGSPSTGVVRVLILCTSITWCFYDFTVGSLAGVICEALTIISIIVSLFRYGFKPKPEPAAAQADTAAAEPARSENETPAEE